MCTFLQVLVVGKLHYTANVKQFYHSKCDNLTPIISALWKLRQKENYKAEVILGYKKRGRYLWLQNERMKEKRKRKKPSEPQV